MSFVIICKLEAENSVQIVSYIQTVSLIELKFEMFVFELIAIQTKI